MASREPKERFGVPRATLRFLEKRGLIRRLNEFDFRELLLLRSVAALRAANLSTRAIHTAIRELQPWISDENPLSRLSLQAMQEQVVVRDGGIFWMPKSRQYVLPLELTSGSSHLKRMAKRAKTPPATDTAHDHYLRGAELEKDDTAAARAAYEACLQDDRTHLNARINLGRLLHLEGRHREAESIYRDAHHPDAVLFFNLAVLLADVGRFDEAIGAYREALIHDPGMEDAHFNLALLYERDGATQAAFRHLLAYRRLSQLNAKGGV